jgi:hypothetical protein
MDRPPYCSIVIWRKYSENMAVLIEAMNPKLTWANPSIPQLRKKSMLDLNHPHDGKRLLFQSLMYPLPRRRLLHTEMRA